MPKGSGHDGSSTPLLVLTPSTGQYKYDHGGHRLDELDPTSWNSAFEFDREWSSFIARNIGRNLGAVKVRLGNHWIVQSTVIDWHVMETRISSALGYQRWGSIRAGLLGQDCVGHRMDPRHK
jgi:hypothetical protein